MTSRTSESRAVPADISQDHSIFLEVGPVGLFGGIKPRLLTRNNRMCYMYVYETHGAEERQKQTNLMQVTLAGAQTG